MNFVLSAGSLYHLPLHKAFEIGRDTGFEAMELIINQHFQYGDRVALVRSLQRIHPVHSFHAPFLDLDNWGCKIDQLLATVELAIATGVPMITFHPPSWQAMELKFWRWMRGIRDFQSEVGQGKVRLNIENMPWSGPLGSNGYVYASSARMMKLLEERNLFLTFDTAHMGSSKAGFIDDFHRFYDQGRIRNIHFSDYKDGREHLLPGHGILPLTRFLNHLWNTDYDGGITLEFTPREFPEDEGLLRQTLTEVLIYLYQETQRECPLDGVKKLKPLPD